MDFNFAEIYSFKLMRITTIATFLILLVLGVNTFNAQANDNEHHMFMHDLKHTGQSAYHDVHINKLKWN